MEFRSETINYSKTKRKGINKRETVLQGKIHELDNRICQGNGDLNQPCWMNTMPLKKNVRKSMITRLERPCSAQKLDGLKRARNLLIIFST